MAKRVCFANYLVYKVSGCFFLCAAIAYSAILLNDYFELQNAQKKQVDRAVALFVQELKKAPLDTLHTTNHQLFSYLETQLKSQGVKRVFLESGSDSVLILSTLVEKNQALEKWTYSLSMPRGGEKLIVYVSNETIWTSLLHRLLKYVCLILIQTLALWGLLRFLVSKILVKAMTAIQSEFTRLSLDDPKKLCGDESLARFVEYQLLLNGMNKIIHGLVSSRRELFELNNQLEEKVKEKTCNLEEKNNTLIQLNKKLSVLANTDSLTQVYNRTRFDLLLTEHVDMAERRSGDLSLLLIDLDDFKLVNDQLGHQVGDHVLRHVAGLLKEIVGDDGLVARWGGEEFAVLLPYITANKAEHIAESLRCEIETASFEETVHITVSVGVAQLLAEESSLSFFKRADSAMYEAKNKGRNCVIVASQSCLV